MRKAILAIILMAVSLGWAETKKVKQEIAVIGFEAAIPEEYYGGMFMILPVKDKDENLRNGYFIAVKGCLRDIWGKEVKISRYIAEEVFRDYFDGETSSVTIVDIGIMPKYLNILYIGMGIALKNRWRNYYDNMRILGNRGEYFIDEGQKVWIHLTGGILIGLEHSLLKFKFGLEGPPMGATLGIGIGFKEK